MRHWIVAWGWLALVTAAWAQTDATELLAEARQLARSGRHAEAIPLYERLTSAVERQLGGDSWTLAYLLHELAVQHHALGQVEKSEPLYRRSLEIGESQLGAENAALVPSLRGLGGLLAGRGSLADAEVLFRRAAEIQETEAADDPDFARTLAEMGLLRQLQGRVKEAERLYRRATEVGEANGLADVELGTIFNNLGALVSAQERPEEAEPHYRRALELRERALGPDHPDVAFVLDELASLVAGQRRFAEAVPLYRRTLAIREKAGHDPVALSDVESQLANAFRQLDRLAEAERHFRGALARAESGLGRDHPDVGLRANNLAVLLSDQGRYDEAEELYLKTLRIEETAVGENHVSVAVALVNLAGLNAKQGRLEEARARADRAKAILEAGCSGAETSRFCRDALEIHRDLSRRISRSKVADGTVEKASESQTPEPPTPQTESSQTESSQSRASQTESPQARASEAPPPASKTGKVYRAQVAARRDRTEAERALRRLRTDHPDLLSGVPSRVVRVDLGERGVWFRVQLGESPSSGAAQQLCQALAGRGHEGCWVIATGASS